MTDSKLFKDSYEFMISQFVDNELSASEQRELFIFLSESEEGRKTLSDYMEMKKETKLFYAGINPELNKAKIVATNNIPNGSKGKKYKTWFYFSAAASIVFALLFLSNFISENSYVSKYKNLKTEFARLQEEYNNVLDEKIKLIKINKNIAAQKNILELQYAEVVQQSEKNIEKKVKTKLQNAYNMGNAYLTILAEIPTVKLTEEDYLTQ